MSDSGPAAGHDGGSTAEQLAVYHLDASDPDGRLIDRSGLEPEEVEQISRLMAAMGRLRTVERRLSEASQRYMRLNETDMRALHQLIVSRNRGVIATPGALARQLGITTASTTKMLDRLEAGGHLTRRPHPTDRRAVAVQITPETEAVAQQTVGRQQSSRFGPAARLSPAERDVVIGFLRDTADALEQAMAEPGPQQVS